MKNLSGIVLLTILLLSCDNSVTSVTPEIGEPFKIKLGESVMFQQEDLNIRFDELLEDSRCPEGATCFWAGNGRIVIQLNELKTELNTYLDPQDTTLSGYRLELKDLKPYPSLNKKINKEDYTVELLLMKN